MDNDLNKCPKCGGPSDNGHDRCVPPSAYECKNCCDEEFLEALNNIKSNAQITRMMPYPYTYSTIGNMLSYIKESIEIRREKYNIEEKVSNLVDMLCKQWCVKIQLYNDPIPTECRSKTDEECHECWMKELGF